MRCIDICTALHRDILELPELAGKMETLEKRSVWIFSAVGSKGYISGNRISLYLISWSTSRQVVLNLVEYLLLMFQGVVGLPGQAGSPGDRGNEVNI